MSNQKHYCPECDQRLTDNSWWCKSCQQRHFKENFDNWTTGDKNIDEFIRQTQMEAEECNQYLEWIPFSAFINVNKSEISEVGTLFTANWAKGPADTWDHAEGQFVTKRGFLKVGLTSLGDSASLFLKELKIHFYSRNNNGLILRLLGVTRESVTNNFMMVAETVEWDLRHYVSHHFVRLTWVNKIAILHAIACALENLKSDQVQARYDNNNTIKSHIEIPLNELGLGEGKDMIPVIGYYRYDLLPYIAPEILDGEKYSPKKRVKRVLLKGLNPDPGRMIAPPKIHPQAIYTSRLLKFPALPLPKNNQRTPKRSQSYSEHDNGRTQISPQDLASILVRDESDLMQRRQYYPEPGNEQTDEDVLKQYELSIPNNLNPLNNTTDDENKTHENNDGKEDPLPDLENTTYNSSSKSE
ncbi:15194_t:CDS:2 [Acaulospora colombiana]|uniref:15194_t:CDS:1 n=1 Tax=Acaulospora colombiana TaxID=27376 RepID=A0ACA9KR26_9GLOM|nr:15194_t:CDS:2 [Acaulospora colombiana]